MDATIAILRATRGCRALDPVTVLIEITDPAQRALAHVTLGAQALDRRATHTALAHLREAVSLDPSGERARRLLDRALAQQPGRGGLLGFLRPTGGSASRT